MYDTAEKLAQLTRPRLLIRAARLGMQDYSRRKHLPSLLGYGADSRPSATLPALMELEEDMDTRRRHQDATYSVRRHVELLVAMMAEARSLSASV